MHYNEEKFLTSQCENKQVVLARLGQKKDFKKRKMKKGAKRKGYSISYQFYI